MPFTRPIAGQPVTVEDFGQPVYDGMARQGFLRSANAANSGTANQVTPLAIANVISSAGNPFSVNGASTQFTCQLPGIYSACGIIAAGGTSFPAGMFVGINKNGIIQSRTLSAFMNGGGGYAYETLTANFIGPLVLNDVISLVAFASGGSWTMQPNTSGTINDPPSPSLSIWRTNI